MRVSHASTRPYSPGCSVFAAKVSVCVVLLSSDLVVLKLMVQVLDGVVVGIVVLPGSGTNMRCIRGPITLFCLTQKVPQTGRLSVAHGTDILS